MNAFDQRSTAFLEEMGIGPLWTLRERAAPAGAPQPQPQPVVETARAAEPAAAPVAKQEGSAWDDASGAVPAVVEEAVSADDAIARMDWDELKAAIANCTRCGICKNKKPVYGTGPRQAAWLVTAGAASATDEKEGQPVSGDAGRLLANMLAAVGLSRESTAYVTNLIKCRPTTASGGDRAPTMEEAAACRPYLERELALTGAPLVLTLGQIAANALQHKPLQEPLAQSRGRVHEFKGVKLVTTLHPGELLRRGGDKALAWADLCLARSQDGRGG